MGNELSCGIGVLNNTDHSITFGLSIGGTYYYENDVAPGKIFYRWPGNVFMTVYAQVSDEDTRIDDKKAMSEFSKMFGAAIKGGFALHSAF